MCLIGLSFDTASGSILLAANRDEYYGRATSAAHWWPDDQDVFAGRDALAGGTWLAVNRRGRLAALTNFREGADKTVTAESRGSLVRLCADKSLTVDEILERLRSTMAGFAGFNLLLLDWQASTAHGHTTNLSGWYVSNRSTQPTVALTSGIYGLSNGLLDDPWPKSKRLTAAIAAQTKASRRQRNAELLAVLTDRQIIDEHPLPDTGVGIDRERELAPAFICTGTSAGGYGTRSSAIIELTSNGLIEFNEWSWQIGSTPLVGSLRNMRTDTLTA